MAKTRTCFIKSVAVAAVASLAAIGYGRIVAMPRPVPVAQAVANAETWIKAHPKDAEGYRDLGRIHALAWAYGDKIPLVGSGAPDLLPAFSEFSTVLVSRTGPGEGFWPAPAEARVERPVTNEDAAQLAASIAAYRKAIDLDPNDALSELGLGWMLAQQGRYARELPADYWPDPKPTDAEKISWSKAIQQLADDDPKVRDAASKMLLTAMPRCILILRDSKSDDLEAQVRIDAILRGHFELQALDHYRRAFALRAPADLKENPTYDANTQISAKAGSQILAILSNHPEAATKGESISIQQVLDPLAVKLAQLAAMPQ